MKERYALIAICLGVIVLIAFGISRSSAYEAYLHKKYLNRLSEQYVTQTGDSSSIDQINEIAYFLLENMQSHHGLSESDCNSLLKYYVAWTNTSKNISDMMDSINNTDYKSPIVFEHPVFDDDVLNYDMLWQYALDMHKMRSSSKIYGKVAHEDFMEFVVPYRVYNEPMDLKWKEKEKDFLENIANALGSTPTVKIQDYANAALKIWNEKPFKWTDGLPHKGSIGAKHLTIKGGNCKDFGIGVSYLMRYLGIPAGLDMLFAREGEYASHYWPFIINENGDTFFSNQDIPYWNPARQMDLPATKIYRHTFSEQSTLKKGNYGKNGIHPRFRDSHLKDVTKEYRDVVDICVPIRNNQEIHDLVYLCNATKDDWLPVDIGEVENGVSRFDDIAPSEIACVAAYWDGRDMYPLSSPFTVGADGSLHYFIKSDNFIQSHIYCKYPLSAQNGDVVDRLIGGRIEGANSKDFHDTDLLYTITESPKRKLNKVQLSSQKAYRYVRYFGADSTYSNIAELEIFQNGNEDNVALGCPVFGTQGDKSGKGTHEYVNVFDGDFYTSFDYKEPSGGWSAVDLMRPMVITGLSYSPRNRDNYIRKNDLYELFYWDDKDNIWISLGKKLAVSDELVYDIPEGSLLFLKNHTRGVNERVFEYDKDKDVQIFH